MALRHSPCASGPVTALKLLSLPATHCLIVRYLVLQVYSFRHCSLAFTQSRRAGREGGLLSPLKVSSESGIYKREVRQMCVHLVNWLTDTSNNTLSLESA